MLNRLSHVETSHHDWIRLNLDHIHSDLLIRACGADPCDALESIEWINRPEPEEDEDPPELYGGIVPAQTYCYVFTDDNDDRPEVREALDASGFELFTTEGDHPIPFFFGIDGGGYSFMGAHWIPARTRLAAAFLLDTTYTPADPDRLRRCLQVWEEDMRREGEDLRAKCPEVYTALQEASAAAPSQRAE